MLCNVKWCSFASLSTTNDIPMDIDQNYRKIRPNEYPNVQHSTQKFDELNSQIQAVFDGVCKQNCIKVISPTGHCIFYIHFDMLFAEYFVSEILRGWEMQTFQMNKLRSWENASCWDRNLLMWIVEIMSHWDDDVCLYDDDLVQSNQWMSRLFELSWTKVPLSKSKKSKKLRRHTTNKHKIYFTNYTITINTN